MFSSLRAGSKGAPHFPSGWEPSPKRIRARLEMTTAIDEHHGFACYWWRIADAEKEIVAGTDMVERAEDGHCWSASRSSRVRWG